MKKQILKKCTACLTALAMGATMLTGSFAASAVTGSDTSIVNAFSDITVDSKPMARFWFPDAGAGLREDNEIATIINSMAEGGFGGVEIAMIGDETKFDNEQSKELGWGTEAWNNILKQVLTAANAVKDGFKVDITITAHWPPIINSIDPNDKEASTEMSYAYQKVTADDLSDGKVQLPMPEMKTTDNQNHRFIFTDTFNDAMLAQVVENSEETGLVLDFDSAMNISDCVSAIEGAGYAAGVPDEAACEQYGWDYASVVKAYGSEPDMSTVEAGSKFDADGNRVRMADWQNLYEADLSDLVDVSDVNDSEDLEPGDYVVFATYYRGTGQVASGGSGVTFMYGTTYATNYFSATGIQKVIDYWNQNMLSDPELKALLEENGTRFGGSIFEDSIEASHSGPFWSFNILDSLDEDYLYIDYLSTAVAMNSSNASSGGPSGPGGPGGTTTVKKGVSFNDSETASRIVEDYNLKLGSLYESDHAELVKAWTRTFSYNYRAQGHVLTGLDIAKAASVLDIPEGDNATDGDGLRNMSAAVNLYGKQYLSMEAITTLKGVAGWQQVAEIINGNFAHGVNRVILHGTAYSRTFDLNNTKWPGWVWGGGGASVGGFFSWNYRQAYWEDVNIIADYLSRCQAVLQNGTAKVDVALLNTTSSSFSVLSGNCMQEMIDAGYSYDIMSEGLLESENAVVTDGVLAKSGPAYKAMILNNASNLSCETLEKLIGYAQDGLPVIIYGTAPQQVYGTETAANNDAKLASLLAELTALDNVASVDDQANLTATLEALGVASYAQYNVSGFETLHRTDSEGADYYFIYNANKEATTGTVTLQGTGVPYFLDAWTGEITPIAQYTTDGSSVTFEITLDKNDAHIYAIAPDQQNFGTGLGVYATGSTAEDGEIVYDNGAAVYRSNTPGTAEVTLSDGTTRTVTVDAARETLELNDGWNLTIRSCQPDDSAENMDAEGNLIDPAAHAWGVIHFNDIALTTWNNLEATEEQLKEISTSLNDATMADVSGIGTYTTSFTLPESWDENTGCYISFTHGDSLNKQLQVVGTSDMVTQIIVNGHEINRINSINDTVDIGNYLQQGTNVLEIKLDTTNWNRMSLDGYYRSTPWLEQSKNVENGLKTVTLTPYTEVELTQAQPIVSIDAPESVQVNEPFAVTVVTASDVTALKLFNEYGLSVAVQNSAVVKNADGTKTWTLDTAMGTVGNGRTLTVAYRTDENYYTQGGSFTLDITSVPPILESFTLPDSAVANRTFIVQATTDMEAAKIVVYNEFGAKMGIKSLSCKVVDGQKVWTGVMAIGTKGDRTLTAYAVNKYGVKSEALTDTVTVKAFA